MKSLILTIVCMVMLSGCKTNDVSAKKDDNKKAKPLEVTIEETVYDEEPEIYDNAFETEISSIIEQSSLSEYAVSVIDLYNNKRCVHNDHKMQAASLIKLYIAGCVYENYDAVQQYLGSSDALEASMSRMITASDNDAANTLTLALGSGNESEGMYKINSYCESHGYSSTHMGRLLLHSNEFDDNYTSVNDCGNFLEDIYNGEIYGADSILSYMKNQERISKIPAGVPSGVTVANKTGELADVENDVAIIFADTGAYALSIMTEYVDSPGNVRAWESQLSADIYVYMTEN